MRAARTATGSEHEQSRISTAERHMELWGPDGSTRRTLESHCEHVAPLRATVTIMLCQVRGLHSMSVTHTIAIQWRETGTRNHLAWRSLARFRSSAVSGATPLGGVIRPRGRLLRLLVCLISLHQGY